jgi:hypothetical protein
MSFFKFTPEDIINTRIVAYPKTTVFKTLSNGNIGDVYLEKTLLNASLVNRRYQGFSERLGGFVEKNGPFSSSIEVLFATSDGTNSELYASIENLYNYYSLLSPDYNLSYSGVQANSLCVIAIPEIYYDREVASGSFSASDHTDATVEDETNYRYLYDNGRGGIYSGSMTGTLVGNIFYSEGLVILKKPDLTASFGQGGLDLLAGPIETDIEDKYRISFRGTQKIPVKIFRCRAPAGELNCSTNPTYFSVNSNLSSAFRNERKVIMPKNTTYITKVGLYNAEYRLVGVVSLAHPIRKDESQDILFRVRFDF